MFEIAYLIGIYSFIILALGLAGVLNKNVIFISSVAFFIFCSYTLRGRFKEIKIKQFLSDFSKSDYFLFFLLLILMGVNFIDTLVPELSFDALWYHLTIPKIYLQNSSVNFIPGNLLYYSAMPKLVEILYVPAIALGNEIVAKIIHFSFGILCVIAIYKLCSTHFNRKIALLASVIFYGNLVVAWQSTVAYVDLGRTFFEITAVWAMLNYIKTNNKQWLIKAGLLIGLAVSVKLLSLISVAILVVMALIFSPKKEKGSNSLLIIFFAFIVVLPWLIFSFVNTGNPVYPYFSVINLTNASITSIFSLNHILAPIFSLIFPADPISPIYLIFIPIMFLIDKNKNEKFLWNFSISGIILWLIIEYVGSAMPEIKGGTRFILPYLAILSITITAVIYSSKNIMLIRLLTVLSIIIISSTIFYRIIASVKYLPFLTGKETKHEFLTEKLNFGFGDFYDTDNYFKNYITDQDKVLLYGFHNLYYVDFPFIDSSWVKRGNRFNYVAIQNTDAPGRFRNWKLIHKNKQTGVKVYSLDGLMRSY